MWDGFVELLRAAIFGAAHLCGGSLGSGIFLVSAGVRLALLPLTLRLARRAREQQARMAELQPQVEALQRRFANDPRRLFAETRALYRKHDIRLMTPTGLLGVALQFPVLGGLFSAVRNGLGAKVRFLWVADLARPDVPLLLAAAALAAWGVSAPPPATAQTGSQSAMTLVAVVLTIGLLWTSSSAVVLSVGAGSLVSVLQNRLITRTRKAEAR